MLSLSLVLLKENLAEEVSLTSSNSYKQEVGSYSTGSAKLSWLKTSRMLTMVSLPTSGYK